MIKEAFNLILHVNQTINTYGKYNALVFVAILILFLGITHSDRKSECHNMPLFLMLAGMILVWNPLFVAVIVKYFPYFSNYWQILWTLPTFLIIAQAATIVFRNMRFDKKLVPMVVILIALAGTILPYQSTMARAENTKGIPSDELEVLALLQNNVNAEEICMLAPDTLMIYARRYSAKLTLVYGKDLWMDNLDIESGQDSQYRQEEYELYQLMQAPDASVAQIAVMAAGEGCNCIVLPLAEEDNLQEYKTQMATSGYTHFRNTAKYHIYLKRG